MNDLNMKMKSTNQIFQKNKELNTRVSIENIKDLAKIFNVEVSPDLTEAVELVQEFRNHCGRISKEIEIYISIIESLYAEILCTLDETPKYYGRTISDAVRNLKSIAEELEDLSHGS
jgi:DNA repair ATPase RecN